MRRSSSVDDLKLLTRGARRLDIAFVVEICFDHVAENADGCEAVQFNIYIYMMIGPPCCCRRRPSAKPCACCYDLNLLNL